MVSILVFWTRKPRIGMCHARIALGGAAIVVMLAGCAWLVRTPPPAPGPPPLPNMPAANPWLADSVYPTSHFNPAATDSVPFGGLVRGSNWSATRT